MSRQNPLSLGLPIMFALMWASSYVTARIGLEDISPLLFVTLRLGIAAPILLALIFLKWRDPFPPAASWAHLLIGGALVHGVTLGAAHVALMTVQAAPLALVHAFHPVLTAALAVPLLKEKFTTRQWGGMGLGLLGVAVAFPFATTQPAVIALVLLSLAGLTGGTLYLKHFTADAAPFPATAIQLIGGALASGLALALFEAPHADWTPSLVAMLSWNTVVISMAGMAIYSLMLMRGQAGRAASAFFIVPGSAAIMAWGALGQTLSQASLFGLLLATFGVWLVWRRARAG